MRASGLFLTPPPHDRAAASRTSPGWQSQEAGPRGRRQLTVSLLVLSMVTAAVAVVVVMVAAVAVAVTLEPGLPVPADTAHDDGDAGEDDDHTYDCACHQYGRHKQVAVLRAL